MERDEFTFPISSPNHSPIHSPPLWQLSPSASPTPSYGESRKGYYDYYQNGNFSPRRSCTTYLIEGSCLSKRSKMEENDEDMLEDKMDMLWEDDLDEEMYRKKIEFSSKKSCEMVEFGCVPTSFKFIKSSSNVKNVNNSVVIKSKKKPSIFVLMKVLNKFFAPQQFSNKRSR